MREVQILVPTYYGNQLAVNCIGSLLKEIPNADVRIFKNDQGWLKASNKLMEEALSLGKDVLLMNDDTYVLTNLVKEAQEFLITHQQAGIIGGKALDHSQATIINYGIYIAPDGNTAHKYYGKRREEINEPEKQRAVEGSCMFITYECLKAISGFDIGYGNGYREEVDAAFRARELGFEVWSNPKMEYVHFVNQTHGKLNIQNDTYEYFMSKWGRKLKLGEV